MPFMEDITKVAKQVAKEAEHAVGKAVKQAGELTDANRHKIEDALDKAGKFVDDKTDGKFSKQIGQAKDAAEKGVEFVAKQKAHLPGQHGKAQDEEEPGGPAAAWEDTSVQDDVPSVAQAPVAEATDDAAPAVGDSPYPNPIPAYTPPKG